MFGEPEEVFGEEAQEDPDSTTDDVAEDADMGGEASNAGAERELTNLPDATMEVGEAAARSASGDPRDRWWGRRAQKKKRGGKRRDPSSWMMSGAVPFFPDQESDVRRKVYGGSVLVKAARYAARELERGGIPLGSPPDLTVTVFATSPGLGVIAGRTRRSGSGFTDQTAGCGSEESSISQDSWRRV